MLILDNSGCWDCPACADAVLNVCMQHSNCIAIVLGLSVSKTVDSSAKLIPPHMWLVFMCVVGDESTSIERSL